MEAQFKAELRDINEHNFARFDAKLEQRVADLRAEFETDLARVELRVEAVKNDVLRWMFAGWTGLVLLMVGTLLAVLKAF